MDANSLMNVLILVGCLSVAYYSTGRMDEMTSGTDVVRRLRYTILCVGSIAGGLSPWLFPSITRIGGLFFVCSVLFFVRYRKP